MQRKNHVLNYVDRHLFPNIYDVHDDHDTIHKYHSVRLLYWQMLILIYFVQKKNYKLLITTNRNTEIQTLMAILLYMNDVTKDDVHQPLYQMMMKINPI